MVAGGMGGDALLKLSFAEGEYGIAGTAGFECTGFLKVLAFEIHGGVEHVVEAFGCEDGGAVDVGLDALGSLEDGGLVGLVHGQLG